MLGRCVDEARGVEEEKSRLEECALQVQDGGGYLALTLTPTPTPTLTLTLALALALTLQVQEAATLHL